MPLTPAPATTSASTTALPTPGALWVPTTSQSATIGTATLKVGFGNGRFIAVTASGIGAQTYYSTDRGATWAAGGSLPQASQWNAPVYGNAVWVATSGSSSGLVAYSTDNGASWASASNGVLNFTWSGLTFGAGTFVAVGGTAAMTSTDGVNWSGASSLFTNGAWTVAYGGGLFMRVNYGQTTGSGASASTTLAGVTNSAWTSNNLPASTGGAWQSVVYGNGMWLAASSGTIAATGFTRSGTFLGWTSRALPAASQNPFLAYNAGRFVMARGVASGTDCYTSDDGSNWTLRQLPGSSTWGSVAAGADGFVMTSFPANAALSFPLDVLA